MRESLVLMGVSRNFRPDIKLLPEAPPRRRVHVATSDALLFLRLCEMSESDKGLILRRTTQRARE